LPDKQSRGFSRFFAKTKEWNFSRMQYQVCWLLVPIGRDGGGHEFL
jgi:hypothetical protein